MTKGRDQIRHARMPERSLPYPCSIWWSSELRLRL